MKLALTLLSYILALISKLFFLREKQEIFIHVQTYVNSSRGPNKEVGFFFFTYNHVNANKEGRDKKNVGARG